MKNICQAIELANEAIKLNTCNYEGYHLRAKSYAEQKNFAMALKDSKIALNLSLSASPEIRTILINYHDELIRLQKEQTTDL